MASCQSSDVSKDDGSTRIRVPAIVEWRCPKSKSRDFLGVQTPTASHSVHVDLVSTAGEAAAVMEVRVPVNIAEFAKTTNIFLIASPQDGVQSLRCRYESISQLPDPAMATFIRRNLGGARDDDDAQAAVLDLDLKRPLMAVGPCGSMSSKEKRTTRQFEKLHSLCQRMSFSLHVPLIAVSRAQIDAFCAAFQAATTALFDENDLRRRYGGRGGRILVLDDLSLALPPPAYQEKDGSKPQSKRPRRASSPPAKKARVQEPDTWQVLRDQVSLMRSDVERMEHMIKQGHHGGRDDTTTVDALAAMNARLDDFGARLDAVEQRSKDGLADALASFNARLDRLETRGREEAATIDERLRAMADTWAAKLDEVRVEFEDDIVTALGDAESGCEERHEVNTEILREQIDDRIRHLEQELRQDVSERLDFVVEEVKDELRHCEASVHIEFNH